MKKENILCLKFLQYKKLLIFLAIVILTLLQGVVFGYGNTTNYYLIVNGTSFSGVPNGSITVYAGDSIPISTTDEYASHMIYINNVNQNTKSLSYTFTVGTHSVKICRRFLDYK